VPRITGSSVRRQFLPGQVYRAVFEERAEPVSRYICRRRLHGVDLSNPTAPGHPDDPAVRLTMGNVSTGFGYRTAYPRRATHATCASDRGWITPYPHLVEPSLSALDQLTSAIGSAMRRGRLPFTITCQTEEGSDACADRRAALAALPLDVLMYVEFDNSVPTVAFGPSGDDGRSWRVTLIRAGGRLTEVRMRRSTIIYH